MTLGGSNQATIWHSTTIGPHIRTTPCQPIEPDPAAIWRLVFLSCVRCLPMLTRAVRFLSVHVPIYVDLRLHAAASAPWYRILACTMVTPVWWNLQLALIVLRHTWVFNTTLDNNSELSTRQFHHPSFVVFCTHPQGFPYGIEYLATSPKSRGLVIIDSVHVTSALICTNRAKIAWFVPL
jgi:hypothetical protein